MQMTVYLCDHVFTILIFLLSSFFYNNPFVKLSPIFGITDTMGLLHCFFHFRSIIHTYSTMNSESSFPIGYIYNVTTRTIPITKCIQTPEYLLSREYTFHNNMNNSFV